MAESSIFVEKLFKFTRKMILSDKGGTSEVQI
jgi:hypothetical protein